MSKNWKIVFNPFERYPERDLAIAGIIGLLLSILLFWWAKQTNDGVYHVSPRANVSLAGAITEAVVCTLLVGILLSGLGKAINPRTRVIDILNATLIHRIPLTLGILVLQLPFIKAAMDQIMQAVKGNRIETLPGSTLWISTVVSLLMLAFFVYAVVLLVNGFRTAVHARKAIHYVLFAAALILAEVIYRMLLYPLLLTF
ncbi:YIP1 family protein [Niabella drilacis]|uniref:Yip1 domain-containing protein n=1 Tax=Niabella drilacis (strain DSM 25811 / CCM 8410 / CCUG 62505 / LMG 26954 / E90) TaxID=1285928 RepID=A0A1G6SEI5_NIADE|nr:YIP1 family protein [Niabella drilacis]SDD14606.1 hypothetical protein SAMN04487894_106179 [Niabella drilacis]